MQYHNLLSQKIQTQQSITNLIASWKNTNETIVFTNGCFDILHQGHVEYLCHAKDLGTKLIIGLNTDESVKRLAKAPNRPINNQNARALVLAALQCVDAVVLFNEETPLQLIETIIPHILVKGSDYEAKNIVGYDIVTKHGGQVKTINFIEGFSTTSILAKI
jgi:D-glycero-beta-D-manno-heptose 1-phosphate adenylyltransferase